MAEQGMGSLGGFSAPKQWPPPALAESLPAPDPLEPYLGPLAGLDHLLAFLALGIWVIGLKGEEEASWWRLASQFGLAMLMGMAAARFFGLQIGWHQPLTEINMAALGLMVGFSGLALLKARAISPLIWALMLLPLFGFFHGMAHGAVDKLPHVGFGSLFLFFTLAFFWLVKVRDGRS